MVINVLETKDLLELSLLKCKICRRRLQSPILQVSWFSNVCGTCNSDKNAKRNVDLEALLQKLYLPCNYAERGCEFEGNFDDVCIHEKMCRFQKMKCPLSSYEQCEEHLDDIVEHMESKHPLNVLKVVDNHVSVQNPNAEITSTFYLLVVDSLRFIVRAGLDMRKGHILYAFYCLNYDYINRDDVKISILLKYENTNYNVEDIHVNRLRKSEIPSMFYERKVIKLKCDILESFGCRDSITIKVDATKSITPGKIVPNLSKSVVTASWHKCKGCSATSTTIYHCTSCRKIVCCENCFKSVTSHCNCHIPQNRYVRVLTPQLISIKLHEINGITTSLCPNIGCNEQLSFSDHDIHTKSQCRLRPVNCSFLPSTSCRWTGAFIDLIAHIKEEHADRVNQNFYEILNSSGTLHELCFIKDSKTFLQEYQISQDQLVVTTSKLDSNECDDNYKWLIYFKNSANGCETLTTHMCTNGKEKTTIDISGHVTNMPLTFKVLFKQVL